MAFALDARDVDPGDPRDEKAVESVARDEQRRSGQQRAGVRADQRSEKRQRAEAGDEIEGEIHAKHQELALGEVDDPHHAEDDAEPDAHQAVDGADQNAGDERLKENLDESAQRVHVLPGNTQMPSAAQRVPSRCAASEERRLGRPGLVAFSASLRREVEPVRPRAVRVTRWATAPGQVRGPMTFRLQATKGDLRVLMPVRSADSGAAPKPCILPMLGVEWRRTTRGTQASAIPAAVGFVSPRARFLVFLQNEANFLELNE